MGKYSRSIPNGERVVCMLQHAAVRAAEDVGEVFALVGAHLADVGIQARLPAAVAGAPAELDQQLAAIDRRPGATACLGATACPGATAGAALPLGLAQAALQPRLPADVPQVAAHPLQVDRGAGDEVDGGAGGVHGADDATGRVG